MLRWVRWERASFETDQLQSLGVKGSLHAHAPRFSPATLYSRHLLRVLRACGGRDGNGLVHLNGVFVMLLAIADDPSLDAFCCPARAQCIEHVFRCLDGRF